MSGVNNEHYRTGVELLLEAQRRLREPFKV